MSTYKIFEDAKIVSIEPQDDNTIVLAIETSWKGNLITLIHIPNDPTIFDEIDIPVYNGSSFKQALESAILKEANPTTKN